VASMRKIADEKDARRCLSAAARSGKPLRVWAQAHGVDGRSLHAWHMNLTRGTAPRLVELVPSSTSRVSARYVVRIGEASIEVGDDFNAGTLRRLVEVLRSC
jgi:hypothetical protein